MAPRCTHLVAVALMAALAAALQPAAVDGKRVSVSNTQLPIDSDGNMLKTGEGDAFVDPNDPGAFWFVFNDWGGCGGVDCCDSPSGCASCCFAPPSKAYPDACVYTKNHSVVAYRTTDFETWEYKGKALALGTYTTGVEFRPHVVYNAATKLFVMWYVDRPSSHPAGYYGVAVSATPQGPYTMVVDGVRMATPDKNGDFDIFVDDDGSAYHVRTGFAVEKLNANYTGVTGEYVQFRTPRPSEGPVMFKRNGIYYIMPGTGCCACKGGSTMYVFKSSDPMKGWDSPAAFQGDVGSNTTGGHTFDPHSPWNYVTRAQATTAFVIPPPADSPEDDATIMWVGNQWVSAQEPGHPRDHDLLYWYPLQFEADGNVSQVTWQDTITFNV